MTRRVFVGIAVAVTAFAMLPALAGPTDGTPVDRYVPQTPGTEKELTYFFGPYHIPAGQDANRITLDVPLTTGFIIAVAPNLIDATTGEEPPESVAHIHHAHWLRVTNDTQNYEQYSSGLSWVFGTGEEKTQGSLDDRAATDPAGPRYGISIDGTMPQTLIYMIHNKTSAPLNLYVLLEVTFLYGTRAEIEAATTRPIHPLAGTLWGQTRDATRSYPTLASSYTATHTGVAVASAGHLHPGGKEVAIANLGPAGRCTADVDGDGFPGVTILHSRKMDRGDADGARLLWPQSEEYQMGATKFGWRAPIHQGDVLRQYAPYDVGMRSVFNASGVGTLVPEQTVDGKPHASYQAMSYTGVYIDWFQAPPPVSASECDPANFRSWLVGEDTIAAQAKDLGPEWWRAGANEGVLNHAWEAVAEPVCGVSGAPSCKETPLQFSREMQTDRVHIAAFRHLPGDLGFEGELAILPTVKQGSPLQFVNEDAALNIRHTITSCPAPCNGGSGAANYPLPDGTFDSGKLGNIDPIDGGLTGSDTVPLWSSPSTLQAGLYTYYCRIHPFMRGAFKVVT